VLGTTIIGYFLVQEFLEKYVNVLKQMICWSVLLTCSQSSLAVSYREENLGRLDKVGGKEG